MSPPLVRRALLALIAVGPAAWLLLPPVLGAAIPGVPTAGIYGVLQAWSAVTGPLPDRFPEPGATPVPDTLAHVLRPLIAGLGVVPTIKLVMLAGFAGTLGMAWRYCRAQGADDWTTAVSTAAFAASPAVIAGVASGGLAWFTLLSYVVSIGHRHLSDKTLLNMSRSAGGMLLVAALALGYKLALLLADVVKHAGTPSP